MALAIFRTEEICPVEKDIQKHNIIIEKSSANTQYSGWCVWVDSRSNHLSNKFSNIKYTFVKTFRHLLFINLLFVLLLSLQVNILKFF